MEYKRRYLHDQLAVPPKSFRAVLITGPRRSGKSTLAKELLNDWGGQSYLSFDTPADQARLASDPEGLLRSLKTPAVLDEVQNAPQVFNYLKKIIDEQPHLPCEYILTGSQQFQMMRHVSESLAGRVLIKELLPFSVAEARQESREIPEQNLSALLGASPGFCSPKHALGKPEVISFLTKGGFPQIVQIDSYDDCADWFNSYVETYVQRDVRALSSIQDLTAFSRFVSLVAGRSAHIINYSELGKDIQVNYKTTQHYLSLLEASYLWKSILPVFKAGSEKRLSKRPKGMFLDTGLGLFLSGINPDGFERSPLYGAMFETFVFLELFKLTTALSKRVQFLHFRAGEHHEVDLVLEFGTSFIPIEIKASATPHPSWGKGISTFQKIFKHEASETGYVISLNGRIQSISDRIIGLPIQLFL